MRYRRRRSSRRTYGRRRRGIRPMRRRSGVRRLRIGSRM